MPLTRRSVLTLISSGTFLLTVPLTPTAKATLPDSAPDISFPQGVASADPQEDAVVLWTRAEPAAAVENVQLLVQVSPVEDFSNILVGSLLNTGPDSDYTVRTYLRGLAPDTSYYYRFLGPKGASSSPAFTDFVGAAVKGSSDMQTLVYTETGDETKAWNLVDASCYLCGI